MAKKGLLVGIAILGAGGAGFLLGREQGGDAPPPRRSADHRTMAEERAWVEPRVEAIEDRPSSPGEVLLPPPPPITSEDFLRQMKARSDSPYAQKMMMAFVGEAARRGPEMLPEIRRLLEEGSDIPFPWWEETAHGYPTLRAALLDAAVATGDPAAAELLKQVAASTQSPVEIAFSAHLLDSMGGMDGNVARRVFDSLTLPMSDAQRKLMDPIVRRVIPSAAAADPAYAEIFLSTQLRAEAGKGAELRLATGVLDGLDAEHARNFTLATLGAPDVKDRAKGALAARAAARAEVEVLEGLRYAVEGNSVTPGIAAQMARGAVNGAPFGRMEGRLRAAIKARDLDRADYAAREYHKRLEEAQNLIGAAQRIGAKIDPEIQKQASIYRDRLNRARRQIAEERAKLLRKQ